MTIKDKYRKTYNYLYKITNLINHKIYIGCHQTNNLDDGYMGSGICIDRAYIKHGIANFKKEILEFYDTAELMFEAEKKVVTREFVKDDTNYNLAEGGGSGFAGEEAYLSASRSQKLSDASRGTVTAKTVDGQIIKVSKNDGRFKTKELVGATKGLVVVKDVNGQFMQVPIDDHRIQSGELVGATKGLAVMKDNAGNRFQVPVDDPRILSGELVGNTKGATQSPESNLKRSLKLKGISKPLPYETCQYCGKSTTKTNIVRWHKNCKITT